jgi:hypothetical protein
VFQIQPLSASPTPEHHTSSTLAQKITTTTEVYHHPDNLFNLFVPATWSRRESQSSVTFTDPYKETTLSVQIINTGYSLDQESFSRFVDIRESNIFSGYEGYTLRDRQQDEARSSVFIEKQFLNRGIPTSVGSFYLEKDQAILILDFWARQDEFEAYRELLETIAESVNINTQAVSKLQAFSSDNSSDYQNDYFAIKIPAYWEYERISADNSLVDTFYSPDKRAIIQIVIYDDGEFLAKTVAGDLVRSLLSERYTKGVTVSSDNILPDGRERLIWRSDPGKYQGVSLFETQDTALLLVTAMWKTELNEYYQWLPDDLIDTYKLNKPEGQ